MSVRALGARLHPGPAGGVRELELVVATGVLHAPGEQPDEDGHQVDPGFGEGIAVALTIARLLVGAALQQPVVDEGAQVTGGGRGRQADALDEVVEAVRAVVGLAEDEHRWAGAHDGDGLLDRADADGGPAAAVGQGFLELHVAHLTSSTDFRISKSGVTVAGI